MLVHGRLLGLPCKRPTSVALWTVARGRKHPQAQEACEWSKEARRDVLKRSQVRIQRSKRRASAEIHTRGVARRGSGRRRLLTRLCAVPARYRLEPCPAVGYFLNESHAASRRAGRAGEAMRHHGAAQQSGPCHIQHRVSVTRCARQPRPTSRHVYAFPPTRAPLDVDARGVQQKQSMPSSYAPLPVNPMSAPKQAMVEPKRGRRNALCRPWAAGTWLLLLLLPKGRNGGHDA